MAVLKEMFGITFFRGRCGTNETLTANLNLSELTGHHLIKHLIKQLS